MTGAYGNIRAAEDLLALLRLDDVRDEGYVPQIHAVVLTTHDLNLRFVLTELLPGYLPDPEVIPPGLGPGHRSYRGPMLDLPPVALLHAPEASVSLDTPWLPPTLELYAHRGARRQHAKVTAVFYSVEGETYLRLVAASANLTRRAFANNLEVAAYEDFELGPKSPSYPSLFELGQLLDALARDSNLGGARGWQQVREVLPTKRGRRSSEALHFAHSADPDAYVRAVGAWLADVPEEAVRYSRGLVVSPFFSAKGPKLHAFWRDRLQFNDDADKPLDVVVDGREPAGDAARAADSAFTTPPRWLAQYRGEGSKTYRPARLTRTREGDPRGTRVPGRPLHAKLIALGYARQRSKRIIWRALAGSSNFTEGGLGLLGEQSNIEAGFLLEHAEREPGDWLGAQSVAGALCIEHELPEEGDRTGPDLSAAIGATNRGKAVLALLDEVGVDLSTQADGTYLLRVDLGALADQPDSVSLGRDRGLDVEGAGRYTLTTENLEPFYLRFVFGEMAFCWPLPVSHEVVAGVVLATATSHRRVDRLMDYWLRRGASTFDPEELEESDAGTGGLAPSKVSPEEERVGSWRLNRLLLGARRRLAESVRGKPPRLPRPEGLMDLVRLRDLLELATAMPVADRLYFGTLLRASLLGYAEANRRGARAWEDANEADVLEVWRGAREWAELEASLAEAAANVPAEVLADLDAAAGTFYDSVREGEVVDG